MKNSQPKAGFTLVELLTVIVIILVIASIVLPVFGGAKGRAKRTVCVSNLHQLHLAMTMYHDDNDGQWPRNNAATPEFQPYYKVLLECSASTDPSHEQDYIMMPGYPDFAPARKIYDECRAIRGANIPIAKDINHEGRATQDSNGLVIFVRENGTVQSKPRKWHYSAGDECPDSPLSDILNL